MKIKALANTFTEIFPGFLVALTIGMISNVLSDFLPGIGSATIAILVGILIGNLFLNQKVFQKGYKFSESNLLSYSVVLLGGTLSLSSLMEIGISGISFIICQMATTIILCVIIGRKLNRSTDFIYLMACGNAVCGSSAIAATASAIDSSDRDKGIAITITNVMGIFLMFFLPFLANVLYNNDTVKSSALIGGILQSVGQVVASGLMINEQIKELAMIFKIFRVILLVIVVFLFGYLKNKKTEEIIQEEERDIKKGKVIVPWYVIGFFITCILFTLKIIPLDLSIILKKLSNSLEIIALAGIGLRVNLKELIGQGSKVLIYAVVISICQILSATILIQILI